MTAKLKFIEFPEHLIERIDSLIVTAEMLDCNILEHIVSNSNIEFIIDFLRNGTSNVVGSLSCHKTYFSLKLNIATITNSIENMACQKMSLEESLENCIERLIKRL